MGREVISVLLTLILSCGVITGCKETGGIVVETKNVDVIEAKEVETKGYKVMTRGYLLETYGITNEDLEGIEFDKIVEEGNLGETSYGRYDKDQVLGSLKRDQAKIDEERAHIANNKMYLLEAKPYKGDFPDISTLKYLSVEADAFADDAEKVSYFVDFENNMFYFSGAISLAVDYRYASTQIPLTDAEKEVLLEELENVHFENWKYMYDKEGRASFFVWDTGLEFENGVVVTYHGTWNENGGTPKEYEKLKAVLRSIRLDKGN